MAGRGNFWSGSGVRGAAADTLALLVLTAAVIALLLAWPATASGQCRYEPVIIDTGICPQFNDPAIFNQYAINDKGEIAGLAGCFGPFLAPVVWPGEGPLVGLPLPGGISEIDVSDMNNMGMVVGSGAMTSSLSPGLVWRDGEVIVIQPLLDGQTAPANGVNDKGQVVGQMHSGLTGSRRAYLWEDGITTNLNPILGWARAIANDVNPHGQITGQVWTSNIQLESRAFVLTGDQVRILPLLPGAEIGWGTAINRHGHVVGHGVVTMPDGTSARRGFFWDGRRIIDLGTIEPNIRISVWGFNDLDQVIGATGGTEFLAFIWQHGRMHNLYDLIPQELVVERPRPNAINNRGEIAMSVGGIVPRYYLRPVDPPVGDINKDCVVNVSDLLMLLADWGTDIGYVDIDGSGAVDVFDLLQLLTHWGEDNSVN
jgi:probable HAF family extracellular repeat protein